MMNDRKHNGFHFYSDRKSEEKISNLMHIGMTIQKLNLNSLIYLWLCWVFVATPGLYLVAVCRLPLWCLLLLWSMGSRAWASVVVAHNSKACGILLVQGSTCESVSPELSGRFFTTGPPGKFNN